jgi:GNAT superfamily N-acetyltransferase
MSEPTIRGTDKVDRRTGESAATLIAQIWPDHAGLFRREMQAYQAYHDLFSPYLALAEKSGEVVGFSLLCASMMTTDLHTVTWVAVHPGYRGSGIGARLVGLCVGLRHSGEVTQVCSSKVTHYSPQKRKRLVSDAWHSLGKSLKMSVIVVLPRRPLNPGVGTMRVSTLFLSGHCDAARHRH